MLSVVQHQCPLFLPPLPALLSVPMTIILALVELFTYQSLGSHCPTHKKEVSYSEFGAFNLLLRFPSMK